MLTHWDRVTHICVNKLTIIGSDNSLSPGRRQAIIWTNAGILLIWTLETNFSDILSKFHTFSFKKIHLKISSTTLQQFCLGLTWTSRIELTAQQTSPVWIILPHKDPIYHQECIIWFYSYQYYFWNSRHVHLKHWHKLKDIVWIYLSSTTFSHGFQWFGFIIQASCRCGTDGHILVFPGSRVSLYHWSTAIFGEIWYKDIWRHNEKLLHFLYIFGTGTSKRDNQSHAQ